MGWRLQGTQAERADLPWMCPVPGPLRHGKFSGQDSMLGHPDASVLGCPDPPSTLGKALDSFPLQKSTRSGGMNPQQDPGQPWKDRNMCPLPPLPQDPSGPCCHGQSGIVPHGSAMGCLSLISQLTNSGAHPWARAALTASLVAASRLILSPQLVAQCVGHGVAFPQLSSNSDSWHPLLLHTLSSSLWHSKQLPHSQPYAHPRLQRTAHTYLQDRDVQES